MKTQVSRAKEYLYNRLKYSRNMNCGCGKKPTIKPEYTERNYCDRCFLRYIEQRIRKNIRLNKPIKPRDTVILYNDESKEFFAAKHFLDRVFKGNLEVKETKDKKKATVFSTNLDRNIAENLQHFLDNTNKEDDKVYILDNVLEKEIIEICRILGMKAKATEPSHILIEKMEAKYPDTKFSLYRAFQRLS